MDAKELKLQLESGEGLMTEFKRCGGVPSDDTYQTICSFANRQGGNIFLGVNDDGTISGVPKNAAKDIQRSIVNMVSNPKVFNVAPVLETEVIQIEDSFVIRVWIPVGPAVYSYKGVTYDRIADADVKVVGIEQMSLLYLRKQNEYLERRVYKYVEIGDFRKEVINKARKLALNRTPNHPWGSMNDEELLRSAKLYTKNRQTGEEGYTLAAVLLFGSDDVISDVCPAYRTEGILRKENLDRYDDRIIIKTNLIEAYEQLIEFTTRYVPERFTLEENQRINARDIIVRELVSNLMIHREFISPFPAKLIIGKEDIRTENASRAIYEGRLTLSDFNPVSKNPNIAGVFSQIGFAEELGSGMRNLQKYSRAYSGKPVILEDGDVFRATVPITPLSASRGMDGIKKAAEIVALRDGKISSANLAEYLGVSTRTAQRHIKKLLEIGFIKGGTEKNKHSYQLTE